MSDFYDYDYDSDYDFRTYNEKVRDDNTWRRDNGIFADSDGNPHIYYCDQCEKEVQVRDIEGSTVHDRYAYILCAECGADEGHLEDRGQEVINDG